MALNSSEDSFIPWTGTKGQRGVRDRAQELFYFFIFLIIILPETSEGSFLAQAKVWKRKEDGDEGEAVGKRRFFFNPKGLFRSETGLNERGKLVSSEAGAKSSQTRTFRGVTLLPHRFHLTTRGPYRDISESPSFPSPFMSNIRSCQDRRSSTGSPISSSSSPSSHPDDTPGGGGPARAPGEPLSPRRSHSRWSACTPAAWARRRAGSLSSAGPTRSPGRTDLHWLSHHPRWGCPTLGNLSQLPPTACPPPTLSSLASM